MSQVKEIYVVVRDGVPGLKDRAEMVQAFIDKGKALKLVESLNREGRDRFFESYRMEPCELDVT